MKRKIAISDITMKQDLEKFGFSLSFREKLVLAKQLDELGVNVIELPPIINTQADSLLVKSLAAGVKHSTVSVCLNSFDPESLTMTWNALKQAVHPRIQISVPVSTVQMEYISHKKPAAVIEYVSKTVSAAKQLCPDVEFVAEDFSRSDNNFLAEVIRTAVDDGAGTVTILDSAGDMLPDEFYERVKAVRAALPSEVRLGVSCSNNLFLADSCAVAAVRAGADEIKSTPFGNIAVNLERFAKIVSEKSDACEVICEIKTTELQHGVNRIKRLCMANKSSKTASFTGSSILNDEKMTLNANDDKETVINVVKKLNYDLNEDDALKVYEAFTKIAAKNGIVEYKELDAIVASVAYQVPPTYQLESYMINSGNRISATCHMVVTKGGEKLESVCLGDGPIDAAFQALEQVLGRHYELDDFQIRSVTEGREAMGETVVRLRHGDKIYPGRGISTDIVGSSIMAYISAINKIAYEEALS